MSNGHHLHHPFIHKLKLELNQFHTDGIRISVGAVLRQKHCENTFS